MEEHPKIPSPSLPDNDPFPCEPSDMISRDYIPFLSCSTSEMNGDSISSSHSSSFGYIPIRLDVKIEDRFQDSSSPPVSEAAFSYQSWVDEAWSIDNKAPSILGSTLETDSWETRDCNERNPFASLHESFSLVEESNEFDEAFGIFCNLSPVGCDNLLSGSSKLTCEVESHNQCSGFAPASGVVSSSGSSGESSEEAQNVGDTKQCNESLAINQGPPNIVITETPNDRDSRRPQALLDATNTTSIEQPASSAKPFLENPIQFHYNNSERTEFLVRLSYNEVQTRMPEWLELYQEQLKLLEKESTLSGSRARLPKRKKEI